jgi:hypothetical protein
LKRLVVLDTSGEPLGKNGFAPRELSALADLERMGFVAVRRGTGAMVWKIESVELTDAGRAQAAKI